VTIGHCDLIPRSGIAIFAPKEKGFCNQPSSSIYKNELTSSQLLVGKRYDLLKAKDDYIRRVHGVDAIREESSVLADEILWFRTIDVPGADEGTDIAESTVLLLTI
jgi:hypothetical protein